MTTDMHAISDVANFAKLVSEHFGPIPREPVVPVALPCIARVLNFPVSLPQFFIAGQ
jgi:hypothetical protein